MGDDDEEDRRIENDPLRLFRLESQPDDGDETNLGLHRTADDPHAGEKLHHDGSFGAYMALKVRKLDEQFAEGTALAAVDDPSLAGLFQGVSIHVNGFTDPSHAELRRLMYMHGGKFQNYYHRSAVTHIICSNLPDAKVKAYEKEKDPTPFVRPEWITDSIRARRLLPASSYILERTRLGGPGQRTLGFRGGTDNACRENSTDIARNEGDNGRRQRLARAQAIARKMRDECQLLKGPPKSSRDDPNFVKSFYRASRLHFIGSWKTRLEKLMQSGIVDESPVPTDAGTCKERTVVHVDMDCFFASVAEASHPEFHGLPLAVCHSNAKGSGEISSANYEARKSGVHASMFMARAKDLCPDLIVVPYEFDKYEAMSETVFRIFFRYTSAVQAVSCDEAYLDVTGLGDAMELVARMRRDIQAETSCRASAGVGPNMLLARLATAKAKPDGQYEMKVESALGELGGLDVQELPGIGWRTGEKLRQAGFHRVSDIQNGSKASLQSAIGEKAGALAYDYAFGHDERMVTPSTGLGTDRKSVGAEVNWGVRFDSDADSEKFLRSIAQQVGDRLTQLGMRGSSVTLKIKRRREGAQEPRKFLGMGICDSLTRSAAVDRLQSGDDIFERALPLLRSLRVPFADIRGMGLSVTKLDRMDDDHTETVRISGARGLNTPSRDAKKKTGRIEAFAKPIVYQNEGFTPALDGLKAVRVGPGLEGGRPAPASIQIHPGAIDETVLAELPAGIQREIRREYGLENVSSRSRASASDTTNEAGPMLAPVFTKQMKLKSRERKNKAIHKATAPSRPLFTEYDPMRMSQVDIDVLRELPVELQHEVAKSLEAYGKGFKRAKLLDNPKAASAGGNAGNTDWSDAWRRARRDLDRHGDSLRPLLAPYLQDAVNALQAGSSTSFVAKVETWLRNSARNVDRTNGGPDSDAKHEAEVRQLTELVTAELESPASRMGATAAWSLVRGLARLARLDDTMANITDLAHIGSLADAAAEVVERKYNILIDT